jgi:hypothetical protein
MTQAHPVRLPRDRGDVIAAGESLGNEVPPSGASRPEDEEVDLPAYPRETSQQTSRAMAAGTANTIANTGASSANE